MHLRPIICLSGIFALSTTLLASAPAAADSRGDTSTFSIDHTTQVPGDTLKPGQYSIRILDHLSDRVLLRIDSATGKSHAIFLGVFTPGTGNTGVRNWPAGPNKTPAIWGYSFDSGPVVQFVYPKAEAAQLAKLNGSKVVAIDPESQNMPKLKSLSNDEMREVNLWTLSLTAIGPDRKTQGILAQRYEPSTSPSANNVVLAASRPQPGAQPQVAKLEQPQLPAPAKTARVRAPVVATLPHTASDLPLIGLIGFLSLLFAAILRITRQSVTPEAV